MERVNLTTCYGELELICAVTSSTTQRLVHIKVGKLADATCFSPITLDASRTHTEPSKRMLSQLSWLSLATLCIFVRSVSADGIESHNFTTPASHYDDKLSFRGLTKDGKVSNYRASGHAYVVATTAVADETNGLIDRDTCLRATGPSCLEFMTLSDLYL